MVRRTILWAIACSVACAAAPRGSDEATSELSAGRGYTLANLHPDDQRSRLFAVNYQQAGLIPVCSEVEYLGLKRKSFRFRVVSTGREYEYLYHKAAAEPLADHLTRFFGPSCPRAEIDSLPALDRKGIREGRALVGMSRRGVLIALGPPPRHVNPDPNAPSLMYWKNRFDRVQIRFDSNGRVSGIRN